MIALGRRVYGLGAIALGIVELRYGAFASVWLPVPAHVPGYHTLVCGAAALLIVGGLAVNLPRVTAVGALLLAVLFAAGMLVTELPHTLAKPADWGGWQGVAESTVMALGGVWRLRTDPAVLFLVAYIMVRTAFLTTVETPEPRYVLECFPAVFALAAQWWAKEPATVSN